jgi:hypothetical protein
MRSRLGIVTTLVFLGAAGAAAQTPAVPPAVQAAPPPNQPASDGSLDIGFRGTSTTGDAARYER